MKRRGFLGLLGLAPAAPLLAKELAKASEPPMPPPPKEAPTVRYEPQHLIHEATGGWAVTFSCVSVSPNQWRLK